MSFLLDILSSDKAKFRRDKKQLTGLLREKKDDWIPIDDEEIQSIALKLQIGKRKRVGFTSYKMGKVNTIFHELIGNYGLRVYGQRRGFVAVQTNPYLYTFLIRPKYTEVQINQQRFAYVLANGTIKNRSGRKVIGEIDWTDIDHPEVLIGDDHFGIMNRFSKNTNPQARAVQMMREMSEGVQELFLAVLLLYIISQQHELDALRPPETRKRA